jgi:hypothetical protein
MVTAAYVQGKIYYGYGKAAQKIGVPYSIYRASSGINPISLPNFQGTAYLSANVEWTYMRANKYGNAVWQLIIDGRLTQTFDYLVGNGITYFICSMQALLPINGVECNRIVTITRPTVPLTPGENGYGGLPGGATLMQACPCSILAGGRMEANKNALPLDTRSPSYQILIPALPGVELRIGDIVDDDRGVRLALTSCELTDLGYRLLANSEES